MKIMSLFVVLWLWSSTCMLQISFIKMEKNWYFWTICYPLICEPYCDSLTHEIVFHEKDKTFCKENIVATNLCKVPDAIFGDEYHADISINTETNTTSSRCSRNWWQAGHKVNKMFPSKLIHTLSWASSLILSDLIL